MTYITRENYFFATALNANGYLTGEYIFVPAGTPVKPFKHPIMPEITFIWQTEIKGVTCYGWVSSRDLVPCEEG